MQHTQSNKRPNRLFLVCIFNLKKLYVCACERPRITDHFFVLITKSYSSGCNSFWVGRHWEWKEEQNEFAICLDQRERINWRIKVVCVWSTSIYEWCRDVFGKQSHSLHWSNSNGLCRSAMPMTNTTIPNWANPRINSNSRHFNLCSHHFVNNLLFFCILKKHHLSDRTSGNTQTRKGRQEKKKKEMCENWQMNSKRNAKLIIIHWIFFPIIIILFCFFSFLIIKTTVSCHTYSNGLKCHLLADKLYLRVLPGREAGASVSEQCESGQIDRWQTKQQSNVAATQSLRILFCHQIERLQMIDAYVKKKPDKVALISLVEQFLGRQQAFGGQ